MLFHSWEKLLRERFMNSYVIMIFYHVFTKTLSTPCLLACLALTLLTELQDKNNNPWIFLSKFVHLNLSNLFCSVAKK